MANKLFAALEELENNVDVNGDTGDLTEAELGDTQAQGEVEEVAGEMDEVEQSIEEGEAEAENLEKIEEVVKDSVESGEGLDETSAELVQAATEAIMTRLGMDKRVAAEAFRMPSMESFGNSSGRLASTKVALEAVQGLGQRIMDGLKKIAKYFADLWFKFVAAVKKLYLNRVSYVEGLIKKAKELKSNNATVKADKGEVELNPALADLLKNAGDLVKQASVIAFGEADAKGQIAARSADIKALLDLTKAMAAGGASVADKIDSQFKVLNTAASMAVKASAGTKEEEFLDLKVSISGKERSFKIDGNDTKVVDISFNVSPNSKEAIKVKVASLDEVIAGLEAIKGNIKDLPAEMDKLNGELSKLSKEFDKKELAAKFDQYGKADAASVVTAVNFVISQCVKQTKILNQLVSHGTMRTISVAKNMMARYEVKK